MPKGGCSCPCVQCDIGAHCGNVKRGCEVFVKDSDSSDDASEAE
jgi:hypothetical protein